MITNTVYITVNVRIPIPPDVGEIMDPDGVFDAALEVATNQPQKLFVRVSTTPRVSVLLTDPA
jgi:hypothetical protein